LHLKLICFLKTLQNAAVYVGRLGIKEIEKHGAKTASAAQKVHSDQEEAFAFFTNTFNKQTSKPSQISLMGTNPAQHVSPHIATPSEIRALNVSACKNRPHCTHMVILVSFNLVTI